MKISISWADHPKNVTEKITKIHITMWINERHLVIGTNILIFIKKYNFFWYEMGWMARTAFG